MKPGANFKEQNAIKRAAAAGMTQEAVSQKLGIYLNVVQSFWPKKGDKIPPKSKGVEPTEGMPPGVKG